MLFGFIAQLFSGKAQKTDFNNYPVYKGNDLGLMYSKSASHFRIWAPTAQKAIVSIYRPSQQHPLEMIDMRKDNNGTWVAAVNKDIKGYEYRFSVMIDSVWGHEVPDPYAKAAVRNGQ